MVVAPSSYTSAREIGEHLRRARPVLLDLNDMSTADAKRIMDFCAGVAFFSFGQIAKVRERTYLITGTGSFREGQGGEVEVGANPHSAGPVS